jgi:hypothetical protein
MPEFCRIQYDHYYDQLGSQHVLVVVYEGGSAIDEVWSRSGSLDTEEEIQRIGDRQLTRLINQMRDEGWDIVSKEEIQSLDTTPVSKTTTYQMQRGT